MGQNDTDSLNHSGLGPVSGLVSGPSTMPLYLPDLSHLWPTTRVGASHGNRVAAMVTGKTSITG